MDKIEIEKCPACGNDDLHCFETRPIFSGSRDYIFGCETCKIGAPRFTRDGDFRDDDIIHGWNEFCRRIKNNV